MVSKYAPNRGYALNKECNESHAIQAAMTVTVYAALLRRVSSSDFTAVLARLHMSYRRNFKCQ